jgi:23S rRNA pseudouridine1911/1915/1917 synthase
MGEDQGTRVTRPTLGPAMPDLFTIVHEDDELLVVDKPADLVCHPTKAGPRSSLIGRVRLHLGETAQPQLINRLDRETTGVVLIAKNPRAARELRQLWEQRAVRKEYLAIVHGRPVSDRGVVEAPLGPDVASRVAIKDCVRADGAPAQTEFRVERVVRRPEGEFALLRVWPHTGRKHQIRIHLAHLGHPIVGDKLYGGDERIYLDFVVGRLTPEQRARLILPDQALHAREVRLAWRGVEVAFVAEPAAEFMHFLDGV